MNCTAALLQGTTGNAGDQASSWHIFQLASSRRVLPPAAGIRRPPVRGREVAAGQAGGPVSVGQGQADNTLKARCPGSRWCSPWPQQGANIFSVYSYLAKYFFHFVKCIHYDVLSHYWKYIFCENSDVRGFILSSWALHNFLRCHVFGTMPPLNHHEFGKW